MSTEHPGLRRELGTLKVFSISAGAMISSGLFVLPAVVYPLAGPSIVLVYLLAAVLVVPAMFSKAELATAMPKSGGVFFFIQRSLGPVLGTFSGFASWFSLSLKSAFALFGIGIILQPLVPALGADGVKLIAICFAVVFSVLNAVSVKQSSTIQVALVLLLLTILVAYVALSLPRIDVTRYVPFLPAKRIKLFTATGMIFVSFGGLTKVASVAEEIRDPGRTIPRGMFAAYAAVTLLYILGVFATVGILSPDGLAATLTPLSTGAATFAGRFGSVLLSGAAMLAFVTTANAGLFAASRDPLAMAKDNLIPGCFSRVSIKFRTPLVSILTTAGFMICAVVFLDLESLVKVASTMKLVLFTLVNLSVILMRESKIVSYKPAFRAPGYPYLQIAGIVVYVLLIIEMGTLPLVITGAFFVASLLWYLIYSRSRNTRDSALIRIVERVTSRDLKTGDLSAELREILIERDEIVEDRFDALIRDAEIVDADSQDIGGLFSLVADRLSAKFGIPPAQIIRGLEEREAESTTSIHAGLAIPHIVMDGTSEFEIVVVRSKEGIDYGHGLPPVHIVFALAGSSDERNFHLQALMAIAQIVQNTDFVQSWMKARDTEELRDLILLAQRIRKAEV